MLVRLDALEAIGGIESIRDALIDDCALAEKLKANGPIWLGLTDRVRSIRRYDTWGDVRRMIARSAYAQLNYSPLLLAGTVLGMALTFLAGPLLVVFGSGISRVLGLLVYGLMAYSFQPMLRVLPGVAVVEPRIAADRAGLYGLHAAVGLAVHARPRRRLEGAHAGRSRTAMSTHTSAPGGVTAADLRSGKGSGNENFPVASRLVSPRHRAIILAFYEFVRIADDIADHATLSRQHKLAHLDSLEASLARPRPTASRAASRCARRCASAGSAPQHAQDLLTAFRLDVTKLRYSRLGRPDRLLPLFGDAGRPLRARRARRRAGHCWPANDALCAALQIINHLQDCGRPITADLDRVYVPLDALARPPAARSRTLGRAARQPGAAGLSARLAARTGGLARRKRALSRTKLTMGGWRWKYPVIETLARHFVALLQVRDPLSERVHLGKIGVAALGTLGITRGLLGRLFRNEIANRSRSPTREQRSPARPQAGLKRPQPRLRQLVLCRDAHPAARPARCHVRNLLVLPAGRRHCRFRRAACAPPRRSLREWRARTSTDALFAQAACRPARPRARGRELRTAQAGLPRRHRRHGDGCGGGHPRAGLGHARPVLRPGRERGRHGCRCACSAWKRTTASRSPIISAAPCS